MNARAELIGEANAELKELEAKDDLTAEEVQRAEFLRNAVKQQNVEMLQLDRIKKWEEELQKYEEEHSELTESEWAQQQQRQGIQEAKTLQKGWQAILPGEAEETEGRLTLRKPGAPNNAEAKGKGKYIDGNVPFADGFMAWANLKGTRLQADYEFLYSRHWEYFEDLEHVRAAVELVLSKPEPVKGIANNLSFVGFDEGDGTIYRIEIDPRVKNKYNQIRSVFPITVDQYLKNKLEEPPVLQLSPTKDKQLAGRTLSSFLRYDTPDSEKVNSEKSKKTEKHDNIRRIMYQGFVRSVDEAVRELKLEGMSIELIETAAALPEHIRSKPGALRAEGAYDQQTGTVYLVAENLAPSRVGKVLLHEAVGHKGLHQLFGKRYGSFLEQIANDYADGVAAVASRRGLDLMDPAQRIEAADEFLAEMAETRGGEDVSVWKRIVAAVRGFFRRMGFHATWTDDEIADLFRQSRKTLKRNRAAKGESARLALPDDKANFKSALKDFAAGILNRRLPITVTSETPPVLRNLKLKNGTRIGNRRITVPYSVIEKAIGDRASTTTGEGHALSLEDLEKLPDSLYKPVMVLESDKEDCVEIYTEIFDTNNDPVLVALALDYGEVSQSKNKEYEIRVNSIRSIYGKEHHNTPVNRLKDGKGLYVDMEKAESWKLAAGVQFPGASILRSSNPNITLVNENFKPQNENSSRFSISPEADAEYLAAVERGDMETAQRMVEERIQSDPDLREVKNLHNFLVETSMYGIPAELSLEMANWDYRSKSPYSFSYYSKPGKSWTHTPEGILRVSDHWNFESRGEKHAVTDRPVENGTHWTLAEYRDGVYHVLKTIPRAGANTQKDAVEKFTLDKIQKEYPELKLPQNRRGGQDFVRHKKTGELLGVIANDTNGKRYSVNTLDGKQISILKENAEILSAAQLDEAGKYVYDTSAQKIKSVDPVTYDDDGNVIPLSKRFNKRSDDVRFSVAPDEELEQTDIRKVQKLDHSQYQENTMLAETAEIPVVHVESQFKTLNETQEIIEDKIRKNNGSLKVMNTEQNMQISIQSHGSLDEAVSLKALDSTRTDGTMPEIHAAALLNIEKLLETARLGASHPDWHVHAKNFMRGEKKEKALQIHRFYAAMEYEKNIYGVKMTVREKRNGKTVFYTLEAHDLEIQKINPAVENNRGGVAKAASPGRSPGIQFSMFFEKFKPIVDLLGLKYKENYPFVRFSVAPDDAFVQAWAKVLLPVVSTQYINVDGAAAYLMDHGIEVYAGRDDDTLRKACVLFQIFVLYRIDW